MENSRPKTSNSAKGTNLRESRRGGKMRRETVNGNRLAAKKQAPRRTDRSKLYIPPAKPRQPKPPEQKLPPVTNVLQVSEGARHGELLLNSESPKTRPTPLKLREAAFKALGKRIRLARFLDIGSGCGMMGIEAISRGAMLATMVERSAKMCSFIRGNLQLCSIKPGHGELIEIEALPFLKRTAGRRKWEIVFVGLLEQPGTIAILEFLSSGKGMNKGGQVVVETRGEDRLPEMIGKLRRWRETDHEGRRLTFFAMT